MKNLFEQLEVALMCRKICILSLRNKSPFILLIANCFVNFIGKVVIDMHSCPKQEHVQSAHLLWNLHPLIRDQSPLSSWSLSVLFTGKFYPVTKSVQHTVNSLIFNR